MTEIFARPDDLGEPRASELESGLGSSILTQAGEAVFSGTRQLYRIGEYSRANAPARGDLDEFSARMYHGVGHPDVAPPELPIDQAKARVKDEGLTGELTLPDQPTIRQPVLDLMIAHAHERRDYNAAVSRGPQNFAAGALGFVTQVGAGIVDPVNVAAFSVPVMGEARFGALMARAGEGIAARAGIRAGVGAAQGAVGSTLLEPGDWWLHTQDGQDWTYRDALRNIGLGAVMGGTMHAGIGVLGDLRARAKGLPLEHSAEAQVERALAEAQERPPAAPLSGEGVEPAASPGLPGGPRPADFEGIDLAHAFPDEIFADLPVPAREDLVRAAAADVMADRPGRAGEVLAIAAEQDGRIAESMGIEAYHGSPHDFEQFDISKIGHGEGAQSYGHGLYFAENARVAKTYARRTPLADFIRKAKELYGEFDSPDDAHAAIAESRDFTEPQKRLLAALEKDGWLGFDYPHQAVAAAIREPKAFDLSEETKAALKGLGTTYKVRIKANHEHMLDWDKPLSEQPAAVQRLAAHHGLAETPLAEPVNNGARFYEALKHKLASGKKLPPNELGIYRFDDGREAASRELSAAGVPGIKYLDQGSRIWDPEAAKVRIAQIDRALAESPSDGSAADNARIQALQDERARLESPPTRNFVVFNDSDVEITHKNGEPVTGAERDLPVEPPRPAEPARPDPEAFRRLNEPRPDPEARAEIEASKAAEAEPEPASVDPTKAVSEAEAKAAEADALLKDMDLTEEERTRVDDALRELAADQKAREQMLRDGAACLIEAVA